jgi:serine/threonine protein kinase
MSSGNLPLAAYHRAGSLGSGSYGSVVTVYNDDGDQFALKLFMVDDEEEDEKESGLSLGALREISILRLFRHENAHPNIIAIHDVQTGFSDEERGAGTDDCLSMAMELFPEGSLMDAIEKNSLSKAQKIRVAHGLLSAVAHLHENSILHRDIKSDNVLLRWTDDGMVHPVLIDFSLAKIVDPSIIIPGGEKMKPPTLLADEGEETTHTPSIGTPTYRAPEVIAEEEYGFPSDLWSVGVCLLEMLRGKALEVNKDKGAMSLIRGCLEDLGKEQPFPKLIRGLLKVDPRVRLTARGALESPVFQKYNLDIHEQTFKRINLQVAMPFENESNEDDDLEEQKENATPAKRNQRHSGKGGKKSVNSVLTKRFQRITKICQAMEWNNPMTAQAALTYTTQMSQLCDMEDPDDQAFLDCIVLAHKFFERHLTDIRELNEAHASFENWDIEGYVDNEGTVFMLLDFCLYPRQYLEV